MRKIILFIPFIIVFIVGCTSSQSNSEEELTDSIIKKIDAGKINELTEEERAYWENVIDKSNRGEQLTSDETKLNIRLEELEKELNPGRLLPDRCILRPSFNCLDFLVSETQVQFTISQSYGYDLNNVIVSLSSCKKSSNLDILEDGKSHTFILEDCNNVESEETGKVKEEIKIEYKDNSDSPVSSIGELFSKVN